jgi:hypothetical protein
VSWHRDSIGLWCACFQAYQLHSGDGDRCPAGECTEIKITLGLPCNGSTGKRTKNAARRR